MERTCEWCCKPIEAKTPRPKAVFCSFGCRDANAMFNLAFSDEEINRRTHYAEITRGSDEDDSV